MQNGRRSSQRARSKAARNPQPKIKSGSGTSKAESLAARAPSQTPSSAFQLGALLMAGLNVRAAGEERWAAGGAARRTQQIAAKNIHAVDFTASATIHSMGNVSGFVARVGMRFLTRVGRLRRQTQEVSKKRR